MCNFWRLAKTRQFSETSIIWDNFGGGENLFGRIIIMLRPQQHNIKKDFRDIENVIPSHFCSVKMQSSSSRAGY
jgi:hypothetical protein